MIQITNEYRDRVITALIEQRANYDGSDTAFARKYGINGAIYSRIKAGEKEGLLQSAKWISLGRELNVGQNDSSWVAVETEVFKTIREDILFCRRHAKSMLFVDNCGIGKTFTAKYLAKTEKNTFYIDCTQCRKKNAFIKALARVVGVETKGKYDDIKDETKYYLTILPSPVVIVDEAGALDKEALGLLQEYWNATENRCGWYVMGGNALRSKISRGVSHDKDYFAELYSRLSEKFTRVVPNERNDKINFYRRLITDVVSANLRDKSKLREIVNRCLVLDENGNVSGLRRAESLLILYSEE